MPKQRTFLPYTKARAFARSRRLRSRTEWRAYAKQHKAELDAAGVPRSPEVFYLSPQAKYDRGYGYKKPTDPATATVGSWNGWHDWLGSSYAPRMNGQFLSLKEFLAFVGKRRLTTQAQYQRWRKKHYGTPDYDRTPGADTRTPRPAAPEGYLPARDEDRPIPDSPGTLERHDQARRSDRQLDPPGNPDDRS